MAATDRQHSFGDLRDLRDRALIATLTFPSRAFTAALKMKVEDLRPRGAAWTVQLHEKGGKEHAMPCHHALAESVAPYIDAAGIAEDRKGWLFCTAAPAQCRCAVRRAMNQYAAWLMIRRRAGGGRHHRPPRTRGGKNVFSWPAIMPMKRPNEPWPRNVSALASAAPSSVRNYRGKRLVLNEIARHHRNGHGSGEQLVTKAMPHASNQAGRSRRAKISAEAFDMSSTYFGPLRVLHAARPVGTYRKPGPAQLYGRKRGCTPSTTPAFRDRAAR